MYIGTSVLYCTARYIPSTGGRGSGTRCTAPTGVRVCVWWGGPVSPCDEEDGEERVGEGGVVR